MEEPSSWSCEEVADWLDENNFSNYKELLCTRHKIDGRVLLTLTENDLRQPPLQLDILGDIKRIVLCIKDLKSLNTSQTSNHSTSRLSSSFNGSVYMASQDSFSPRRRARQHVHHHVYRTESVESGSGTDDVDADPTDEDSYSSVAGYLFRGTKKPQHSKNLDPEIWKTILSFCYAFSVFLLTSFVMVVVHDRVPDMERYPPLPDIFLDNVPYIPWAFQACEVIAVCQSVVWCLILLFHKHR